MAARLESLQSRKARLIRQNEMRREELLAEWENFRGAAQWMEAGFSLFRTAGKLKTWTKPLRSNAKKRPELLRKGWGGFLLGVRIWKNLGR